MRTVFLVAALLAAAPAHGGRQAAPDPVVSLAERRAALLWRVERSGLTSHLFGTVHAGLDLDQALGAEGRAALDGASRVFVELDLTSDATFDGAGRAMWARAQLPPGRSLRALLAPEAWTALTALYRGRVPPDALDRMEPWFLGWVTLPVVAHRPALRRGRRPSGPPEPILDAAVAARAKARGLHVTALETALDQIQALQRVRLEEAVELLEGLLIHAESQQEELAGLVGAYASADERYLRKAFGRLVRRQPALVEQVLYRRNERWLERLERWFPDGRIFVAAGAFHMYGERGLPALLRARGYRVTRVPADPPPGD